MTNIDQIHDQVNRDYTEKIEIAKILIAGMKLRDDHKKMWREMNFKEQLEFMQIAYKELNSLATCNN